MEIAAKTQLLRLELSLPRQLARPGNRMVSRVVETMCHVGIASKVECEERRVKGRFLLPRIAVKPGEVGEGKRLRLCRRISLYRRRLNRRRRRGDNRLGCRWNEDALRTRRLRRLAEPCLGLGASQANFTESRASDTVYILSRGGMCDREGGNA